MSNATELKQIPQLFEFPQEVINRLIEKYHCNTDDIIVSQHPSKGYLLDHNRTIKMILSQFGINTDEL